MIQGLKVKLGPQLYQYCTDAIDFVPNVLVEYKSENVLIVHGEKSWEKAKPYLKFLNEKDFSFSFYQYLGECSYADTENIRQKVLENDIDFIIGVGGGKLADLVGYAAHLANKPFGLIPTLASNCAPWTPLSVMYKENGESEGKSEHFLRQAAFLITDPALVMDAPVRYFIAGIVDTLAKWYESDAILSQENLQDETPLMLARYVTVFTKEKIMEQTFKAIDDMKHQRMSKEFYNMSEIVFAIAGLIGGLGDKYARNAAAHALHDGLGKYCPEIHEYLHGEIVGYGMLYQMALEDRYDQVDQLAHFYRQIHSPISLKEMGVEMSEEQIEKVVQFMDSKEKVHLIPVDTTPVALKSALIRLETYMNKHYLEED
ncbi:iron-containing alcohol dehydrogenase family protein [Atopobacter sp. AH10]|uniref:iron-containing alcohol dehydrogenase family protein n=1 Tax=Atopobacter sp. AH10 TaxID=2315861 RepID=UPI000EF1C297|nr:iron-containing alcohol dehydrogenase family protein [Atopobacter sp. AH10]RLK63484.1 iron-containing alcohol dehydrogenase family protein [Atopobacter sp. AH10]